MAKNKSLKDFKKELLATPEVREAYESLKPEYEVARAVIKARIAKGLTQSELAARMDTSQSCVARIENGRQLPTMKTLLRVAEATGTTLKFDLVAATA